MMITYLCTSKDNKETDFSPYGLLFFRATITGLNVIEVNLLLCPGSSVSLSENGAFLACAGPGDSNGVGAAWMFTTLDLLTAQIVYSVDLKKKTYVAGFINTTRTNLETYLLFGSNYTQRALVSQPVHREQQSEECPGYGNVTFPFTIRPRGLSVSEIKDKLAVITREELFGSDAPNVCSYELISVLVFDVPPPPKPLSLEQCEGFCNYRFKADKKSCSTAALPLLLGAPLKTICVIAARLGRRSCLYKVHQSSEAGRCAPAEVRRRFFIY